MVDFYYLLSHLKEKTKQKYSFTNDEIDSLHHYFKIKFIDEERQDDSYRASFELLTDEFLLCSLSLTIFNDDIYVSLYFERSLNNKLLEKMFSYLFNEMIDNDHEEIIKFKKSYNKYCLAAIQIHKQAFVNELRKLSIDADNRDILSDLNPAKIYLYFRLTDSDLFVEGKVGRDKAYSITRWDKFFSLIKRKSDYKYGKNLQFVHDIFAFDQKSQKFINFTIDKHNFDTDKIMKLKDDEASYIFKLYKDEYVPVILGDTPGENNFLVRLNNQDIKIRIDNKYVLSPLYKDKEIENKSIYKKFIFDYQNFIIDEIDGDDIFINLLNSVIQSPFPCIEDNIDEFKYNFLLRYPDKFVIDPEIKEEFIFNSLDIKAYFSYEKGAIELKEQLFLEDKEVDIDDLNHQLLGQYKKYRAIIANLGFIDNLLVDEGKILNFFSSSLDTLKQYCEVYLSDNILSKTISKFNPPNIRVNYENNLLSVFMEDSRYDDDELFAIIQALKKKKKFVLYKDQIISLDNEDASRFINTVENFHLEEKGKNNRESKLPVYYAFKALDDSSGISLNEQIISIFNEIKNYKKSKFECGKIDGELRDYQIEGIKWLDVLYRYQLNGILADDMGLGKTIEIISFIKGEKVKDNVLIVAPKSLVFNWKNEFAKFASDLKILSIYGGQKERRDIISSINKNKNMIYITSYDSLKRDEDFYKDITFDTLILDEAQYIKNSKAQKTISVTNINSKHRFVLTGTPIENSILDLWSIFNFLMPNYLANESEFKSKFESDEKYVLDIKRYVAPFILRRNKKDVLKNLPNKYETIITCEMEDEQRKVYDAQRLLAREVMRNGGKAFDVFQYLIRLRQVCIHPSLFIDNYKGQSGKIIELENIIEDRLKEGHRILIFSQFVMALEVVKKIIEKKDIMYFMITGDTKGEDRVKLAEQFNASKKYKIGLVSLKAGGTGLNLIGADVVIHLDPWWNVAAQDQATDRAYRIGQEKNVEVIKLICENSIEQRVVELQNVKKDLVDKVIAKDDSSITSLSIEDINFILK